MLSLVLQTTDSAVRHQSLWLQIPEIILIPVVALFIITFIKAATAEREFGNEQYVDIGMDVAILATGVCGSVFANDRLFERWGIAVIVYGVVMVLVGLSFIAWLANIRRWYNTPPVSDEQARKNLWIGAIPLGMVTAILILGYTI